MRFIEQFTRARYDLSASRIPVTFLYVMTATIILTLQWHRGMTWQEAAILVMSACLFSVLHWFSTTIYMKVKSFYFLLQGVLVIMSASVAPDYAILILITFGAILVVQAFYFFHKISQFILYMLAYMLYGAIILTAAYGVEQLGFYLFISVVTLVLIFIVLSIFNQKELENRLLIEANERIELLTRQNERQRMARDLHDSLIQKLIALNLKMDVIDAHVQGGQLEKAASIVQMAKQDVSQSIEEARHVVDDLRRHFDDLPFSERLFEEIVQLQFMFQLKIDTSIHVRHEVSSTMAEQLLAIVREAITNVHKHAAATQATIQLYELGSYVLLQIADNGRGMQRHAAQQDGHYGLLGMQERVALLNGQLHIETKQGTQLTIVVPYEGEK